MASATSPGSAAAADAAASAFAAAHAERMASDEQIRTMMRWLLSHPNVSEASKAATIRSALDGSLMTTAQAMRLVAAATAGGAQFHGMQAAAVICANVVDPWHLPWDGMDLCTLECCKINLVMPSTLAELEAYIDAPVMKRWRSGELDRGRACCIVEADTPAAVKARRARGSGEARASACEHVMREAVAAVSALVAATDRDRGTSAAAAATATATPAQAPAARPSASGVAAPVVQSAPSGRRIPFFRKTIQARGVPEDATAAQAHAAAAGGAAGQSDSALPPPGGASQGSAPSAGQPAAQSAPARSLKDMISEAMVTSLDASAFAAADAVSASFAAAHRDRMAGNEQVDALVKWLRTLAAVSDSDKAKTIRRDLQDRLLTVAQAHRIVAAASASGSEFRGQSASAVICSRVIDPWNLGWDGLDLCMLNATSYNLVAPRSVAELEALLDSREVREWRAGGFLDLRACIGLVEPPAGDRREARITGEHRARACAAHLDLVRAAFASAAGAAVTRAEVGARRRFADARRYAVVAPPVADPLAAGASGVAAAAAASGGAGSQVAPSSAVGAGAVAEEAYDVVALQRFCQGLQPFRFGDSVVDARQRLVLGGDAAAAALPSSWAELPEALRYLHQGAARRVRYLRCNARSLLSCAVGSLPPQVSHLLATVCGHADAIATLYFTESHGLIRISLQLPAPVETQSRTVAEVAASWRAEVEVSNVKADAWLERVVGRAPGAASGAGVFATPQFLYCEIMKMVDGIPALAGSDLAPLRMPW